MRTTTGERCFSSKQFEFYLRSNGASSRTTAAHCRRRRKARRRRCTRKPGIRGGVSIAGTVFQRTSGTYERSTECANELCLKTSARKTRRYCARIPRHGRAATGPSGATYQDVWQLNEELLAPDLNESLGHGLVDATRTVKHPNGPWDEGARKRRERERHDGGREIEDGHAH